MTRDIKEQIKDDVEVRLYPVIAWVISITKSEAGKYNVQTFPITYREDTEDILSISSDVKSIKILPSWPNTYLAEVVTEKETISLGVHTSPEIEALRKEALQLLGRFSSHTYKKDLIASGWYNSPFQSEILNLKKGCKIKGELKSEFGDLPQSNACLRLDIIKKADLRKDASYVRSGVYTANQRTKVEDIIVYSKDIAMGEIDFTIPYDGKYRVIITPKTKMSYFVEIFVEPTKNGAAEI